ncbi:MAG: ABC transporter permease [Planctomycetes bacterium]|nr:ABC transporter permease [Planctomycetota bacterium]
MAIPIKYNLRNMRVRWVTTAMTAVGIGLVTLIFVSIFALNHGMERTLVETGHPRNVIVLRPRATESQSSISREQAGDLAARAGIERGADGEPLASPELVAIANLPRAGGGKSNIALRGIGPRARELRNAITVVEGRWFKPNLGELVVGKGALGRFEGLAPGARPFIRGREWLVVGVFAADGQAYESEVWGDLDDMRAQFKREYSTVLVRCKDEQGIERFCAAIEADKNLQLEAKRHADYYRDVNDTGMNLQGLWLVMATVLSIGAVFGAANTMYASVAARTREIATLRVLGFSSFAIWFSFLEEAALLGLLGGVAGSALAWILVDGMTSGTTNWQTFSDLAFHYRVTPRLMGTGVGIAMIMGVVGGFLPAFRATRLPIPAALRGL